ncbi:hypothetical protein FALCPG4_002610 [Fusarium falciforme]
MRLLNTTSLKLEYFVGAGIPKYAILSHRWEAEEILFEDVQTDQWPEKKGVGKVKRVCLRAKDDGFKYIWIDTCCIDKSSSAELSEAINSMFNWYRDSQVCYAYLYDVSIDERETFVKSAWFTRGWTLQELIAPQQVQFFDRQWRKIGDRLSLLDPIVNVTAIDRRVLGRGQHHRHCGGDEDWVDGETCLCGRDNGFRAFRRLLSSFSVAARMSWASRRVTKRVEDQAYALLGLFNVNMPLLYGEGTRAFRRLQEEIIRTSNDQSILAGDYSRCFFWDVMIRGEMHDALSHLFPSQPRAFWDAADLERPSASSKYLSMTFTNHCLNIDLQVCPCSWQEEGFRRPQTGWLGILACVYSDDYLSRPAILLDRLSSTEDDQHAFIRILKSHNTSVRISPVALLDGNEDVEISERGLKVWFNPSHIKMMNIDLLLQAPTQAQGMRTPAIRISSAIGGHDDMTYRIRTSLPELEETPKGHIRDVTFLIHSPQEMETNMRGLLAIDNGSSHGFFVAYGFLVHSITNPEALDFATPLKFDPWCRLLAWRRVVPDREFIPKDYESVNTLEDMVWFNFSWGNNLPKSGDDVHPHGSMEWPERPDLRAKVAMTPNTFLGQTVYDLKISVCRIDGSLETQGSGQGE